MTGFIDPRGKFFSHLDRLAQLQAGMRPPPVNVEVDLSNRCNLGCDKCHFSHLHTRGHYTGGSADGYENTGDLMDDYLALRLPTRLRAWGARSITWTGGGEPSTHPRLADVLTMAAPMIDQGIYTNGTLLRGALPEIVRETCTWVYVSLDHATQEDYFKGKKADAFEQACDGVRRLVAASGRAVVGLGFLLHAQNWGDCWKMLKLGRALGVDYVQFRPRIVVDPRQPGKVAEDTGWAYACIDLLQSIQEEPDVVVDETRFGRYATWDGHGYDACRWCSLQMVITPDGRMWACVNRRGQPTALLGDLSKNEPMEIWERDAPEVVGDGCRVMCRGHLSNLVLNNVLADQPHKNFI